MQHPFFYTLVQLKLRSELRKAGKSRSEINDLIDGITPEVIDSVQYALGGGPVLDGVAAGTHPIIEALLAFLTGPAGAALIAALLKLLGL